MLKYIECGGFRDMSCDDGPGVRSVLFLQGCTRNCKDCHNSKIKEHGKGKMISIDNLIDFIDARCCNKKITISGGEPLEQMDSLIELIERLKIKGYNVCVYTGWEFDMVPDKIVNTVDFIKTGSFISNLKSSGIQYVGSSNQHMYYVNKGNIKELSLAIKEDSK